MLRFMVHNAMITLLQGAFSWHLFLSLLETCFWRGRDMLRQAREFCIHAKTRLREYNFFSCKLCFSTNLESWACYTSIFRNYRWIKFYNSQEISRNLELIFSFSWMSGFHLVAWCTAEQTIYVTTSQLDSRNLNPSFLVITTTLGHCTQIQIDFRLGYK